MNESTPKKPFKPYLEIFCDRFALLLLCSDGNFVETEIESLLSLLDKVVQYTGLTRREVYFIAKTRYYALFSKAENYVDTLIHCMKEFLPQV